MLAQPSVSFVKPFKPNGIFHSYQLDQSISVFEGCWVIFFILFNYNRTFCKKTVWTLIRRRVLWRLIIVRVVCLCPTKRTLIILGLYGLASEFTQQAHDVETSGCDIIINVVSTSMRRNGIASTLIRYCFDGICLLG